MERSPCISKMSGALLKMVLKVMDLILWLLIISCAWIGFLKTADVQQICMDCRNEPARDLV